MAFHFRDLIRKFREVDAIANVSEIARRYFAMNSFDGVLTVLGILIGNYLAHVTDPKIIIGTGIGASIAMGVSGTWGTYLTETAERKHELRSLERQTLTKLSHTRIGKASRIASILVALIDGLSPFLSSFIVLIPFMFFSKVAVQTLYFTSIGIAFAILLLVGMFLGRISKENLFYSGMKMVLAGLVCAGLSYIFLK